MKQNTYLPNIAMAWLALGIGMGVARAGTALEQRLQQEPAPHTLAAKSDKKVLAHYATSSGYLEGNPGNKERLAALKNAVAACVKNPNAFAGPVQPPSEWPEYLHGYRIHAYTTERYAISYRRDWTYAGPMPNCSLLESTGNTATLQSAAGLCQIDLIQKTASGQCDMAAHRSAKVLASTTSPQGPIQVVADLRCGVQKIFDTDNCMALDGRMKPSFPLVLSRWSERGMREKAESAALDSEVSEGIFAPHLQSGFSTTAKAH